MRALIRGTHAALGEIGRGGKVYTHCTRGRHRSVAMGAAILIAQGLSPDKAMGLIKVRGRYRTRRSISGEGYCCSPRHWALLAISALVKTCGLTPLSRGEGAFLQEKNQAAGKGPVS